MCIHVHPRRTLRRLDLGLQRLRLLSGLDAAGQRRGAVRYCMCEGRAEGERYEREKLDE